MSPAATSEASDREIHYATRGSSYYDVLLAVFCVVLVVSNIAATKGTQFFSGDVSLGPVQILPVFSDGGAVLFPLAYIIGDVIAEVYGLKAARRAILVGFGTALMAFATFLIVIQLPSASFYENQAAFESVVWSGVQIVAASLIAYVVGQFLNSYVLVRMKARSAEP
ncbi:MAG: queuosine precursor transporter, partial [Aeromicrobium sp.]